jgi:hypothetical protein
MGTPANTALAYSNSQDNLQVLKQLYSDDAWVMKDLVFNKNRFLSMVDKDETEMGLGGLNFPIPVLYDVGGGGSANLGTAQTYQTAPATATFLLTTVNVYRVGSIQNQFLRASAQNIGAFMPAAKMNVKSLYMGAANDIAYQMFSDGSGTRGSYGANGGSGSINNGVITLDNLGQVYQFSVNMALNSFSVSGATATQSTGGAIGYVIGVDTGAGTVTVSPTLQGAAGTPSGWSTSFPFLGRAGDTLFSTNGLLSANMLCIAGLGAWIPSVAPSSSDSFFTQNRSVSPIKLAGLRFTGSSESIQDALIDATNQLAAQSSEAGDPDVIFINPVSYQTLVKNLTGQGQYQMVRAKVNEEVEISFKALVLPTANGEISIIQDRNCPAQTAYILTMKTWKLRSLGKIPQFLTFPGFYDMLGFPIPGQDAVEIRVGGYLNLACNAPGANAVVALPQ